MREKRGGAMSKMQKLRKRLSLSFGRLCKYLRNLLQNQYLCNLYFCCHDMLYDIPKESVNDS